MRWHSIVARSLVGLLITTMVACSEDTAIRQYRVSKLDSQRTSAVATNSPMTPSKKQLMLGAIVPNRDAVWFFKLTGEPDLVAKMEDQFQSILKSLAFEPSGEPTWKLPENWQEQITPNDITYGRLTHTEEKLTATVTRLPIAKDYVLLNVNRWRKQLALQPQQWEEMSKEIVELPELSQGESRAYLVKLSGTGTGSMAPFAGQLGNAPAPPMAEPKATTDEAKDSGLTYQGPEGWREIEASGMRRAAFEISEAEKSGEVTVIAAGGDIEANIGIWIGQVGVEATEELKRSTLDSAQEISVNGVTAKLYTIVGQAGGESANTGSSSTPPSAILVADVPWREQESLFVKFKGDAVLAELQREKFVDFLKSIKW